MIILTTEYSFNLIINPIIGSISIDTTIGTSGVFTGGGDKGNPLNIYSI